MKKRFKQALFAFFKKEIMNSIGYVNHKDQVNIISQEMDFVEISSEIVLDNKNLTHEPSSFSYENALHKCKRKLFDESMKYIKIDENSLMDSNVFDGRRIKVKLFVGKPKTIKIY